MKNISYFILCAALLNACSGSPKGKIYKQSDYGKEWPFTVDELDIYCDGYNEIYAESEGTIYAFNGSAIGRVQAGHTDITEHIIDEIQLPNADFPDAKKLIPSEIFTEVLETCKNNN